MTSQSRHYGYELWYTPADNPKPKRTLPNESSGARFNSPAEAQVDMLRNGLELEKQGYIIQGSNLYDVCARCSGVGTISVKPKGWRKKTPPPSWACTHKPCPACSHGA